MKTYVQKIFNFDTQLESQVFAFDGDLEAAMRYKAPPAADLSDVSFESATLDGVDIPTASVWIDRGARILLVVHEYREPMEVFFPPAGRFNE